MRRRDRGPVHGAAEIEGGQVRRGCEVGHRHRVARQPFPAFREPADIVQVGLEVQKPDPQCGRIRLAGG